MPKANNPDAALYLLIGIIVAVVLFVMLVGFCMFLNDFSRELRYLNAEIARTRGAERRYWKRKKRKLWLSLIPFVKYK